MPWADLAAVLSYAATLIYAAVGFVLGSNVLQVLSPPADSGCGASPTVLASLTSIMGIEHRLTP